MRDPDRRLCLVDVLAAGAAGTHRIDLQVRLVDLEVDLLRLRHHGNGRGGGVDAPLRLCRRHALHAVHAALELQLGEGAAPDDFGDDFLVAAGRAFARGEHFDLPALRLRKFYIHSEEIAREQSGLVAARPGSNLENDVAVVGRVLRQERDADFLGHLLGPRDGVSELGLGHVTHFRVERGIREHGVEFGPFPLLRAQGPDGGGDRLEFGEFTGNLGVLGAGDARAQARTQFLVAAQYQIEIGVDGHFGGSKWMKGMERTGARRARYSRTARRLASASSGSRRLAWSPPTASMAWISRDAAQASSDNTIAFSRPIAAADIDRSR